MLQWLDDSDMKELGITILGDQKKLRLLIKDGPLNQQRILNDVPRQLGNQNAGETSTINEATTVVFLFT